MFDFLFLEPDSNIETINSNYFAHGSRLSE